MVKMTVSDKDSFDLFEVQIDIERLFLDSLGGNTRIDDNYPVRERKSGQDIEI